MEKTATLERYKMLDKKRIRLKAILTMLEKMGVTDKTLNQMKLELERVRDDMSELLWW